MSAPETLLQRQRMAAALARQRNAIIRGMIADLGRLTHADLALADYLRGCSPAVEQVIAHLCEQSSDALADSLADWLRADGRSAFVPSRGSGVPPEGGLPDADPPPFFP